MCLVLLYADQPKGNGFTFEAHTDEDYKAAVRRALKVHSTTHSCLPSQHLLQIYRQPALYVQLRKNAYESVIDAKVWCPYCFS